MEIFEPLTTINFETRCFTLGSKLARNCRLDCFLVDFKFTRCLDKPVKVEMFTITIENSQQGPARSHEQPPMRLT